MLEVDVVLGGKHYRDVEAAFADVAQRMDTMTERMSTPLSTDMRRALKLVAAKMKAQHGTPWSGVNPGAENLHVRSGGGLKSIEQSIRLTGVKSLNTLVGRITTGKMTVHETGATIRAKSAGYLTIPLPTALDSRGIPLKTRARDWTNTFVARSRKGNLLIFQKRGRNNIVPLYILKKEVRLPPRLGMEQSFLGDALPYFERKIFEQISNAFDGAFR